MGKIVWKSFRHNYKNFIAFFASVMLSVAVLFLLAYLGQAAGMIDGVETKALAFAYRSELKEQLRAIIPVMILITILVIGYSVRFYIQSREKDYGIFRILGIQKKDMRRMVVLEYTLSCGIACGAGLILGKAGTMLAGCFLGRRLGQSFAKGISMGRVYRLTALLCAVLIAGSLLAVFMAADARGMTGALQRGTAKEKRLESPQSVLYFLVGAGVIAGGLFMADNEPMMAHMAVFLVCAGVCVRVFWGMGYILERFRGSGYYRSHILSWNHVYHYWKRHRSRAVIQMLLGILAVYFSFLMIRGTLHERQMPNDFVCISEEGDADVFLGKMQSDFGAECVWFPFVWVNEPGGDSWIGMSETDYHEIFAEGEVSEREVSESEVSGGVSLAEGEIYRIWREEGSRESMLDHSGKKRLESVTLGKCSNTEWEEPGENGSYRCDFRIKDERIEELLGFSLTGIAVLPDRTVKEAADKGQFHQVLMIINADKGNLSGATAFAEEQRGKGVLKEAFCRRTITDIDRKENVLNRMIVGIVTSVILLFGMFVIWLMHFSEMDEKRARHRFLCVLGMERRRAGLAAGLEALRAVLVPVLLAAGISRMFCRVFLGAYYEGAGGAAEQGIRGGAGRHAALCTDEKLLLVIVLIYLAGEVVFGILSQMWCKRQLEKE